MKLHLFTLCALFLSIIANSQEIKLMKLRQQPVSYHLRNYYVSGITDIRPDTASMGTMRTGLMNKLVKINLKDGVSASLSRFLDRNLTQDKRKTPIEVRITSLDIAEKLMGFREQADLSMGVAFYSNGSQLIEYKGSAYVQTGLDASAYIEQLIRQNLEKSLQEFDEWLDQNADATGTPVVHIHLQFAEKMDDPDDIAYAAKPLVWEDFKGVPDKLSLGAAATYSGIGLKLNSSSQGGKIDVDVLLSAYFNSARSWCKAGSRNPRVLRHEQLHFDITALMACHLAEEIRRTTFSVTEYASALESLHRKYTKMLEERETAYDEETNHGTEPAEQLRWEKMLEAELGKMTCFR